MSVDNRGNVEGIEENIGQRKSNNRRWLLALLVFCVFFAMIYTARLRRSSELTIEAALWEQRIKRSKDKQANLAEWQAYVESDAFVAEKAREELGWTQEGDELILMVEPLVTAEPDVSIVQGVGIEEIFTEDESLAEGDSIDRSISPSLSNPTDASMIEQEMLDQARLIAMNSTVPVWRQWLSLFVDE